MNFMELVTLENIVNLAKFIVKPLIILLVCKIVINILLKIVDRVLLKSKLDGGIKSFTKSASKIILWAIAIIFIADSLGVNTASLVTVLGVVGLALSLSVQGIATNVFSGITILLSKPFVVGDYVDIGGVNGTVTSINLMRTSLITVDNKVELIPNSDVASSKITNFNKEPMRRVDINISASYDASTADVKNAINEVISADKRIYNGASYNPFIRLSKYNANDIEYTIRVWVDTENYWDVYFDLLENIRESFNRNKIEFSYPHTIIHTPDLNIKSLKG